MGGGILLFIIFAHLHATELSTFCTSGSGCDITTPYSIITNHSDFTATGHGIHIKAKVGTFTNYGTIRVSGKSHQALNVYTGSIGHFINYGTFVDLQKMGIWIDSNGGVSNVTNYGIMGSISMGNTPTPLTLNNLGLIGAKGAHIKVNGSKVSIQNYMVKISKTAMSFNNFTDGYNNNPNDFSHLVIQASGGGSVRFKNENSKIILGFGDNFEFGEKYLIDKIATDTDGKTYSALGVEFSRLIPYSDIFSLSQSGEYFIATLNTKASTIGNLHKSNVRTMNNFYTISNSMIYPRKSYYSQNLGNLSSLRASEYERGNPLIKESLDSALDSANPIKSYESFSYRSEAQNRRIQRQNKRNYNRRLPNQRNSKNLNADSANKNNQNNLRDSANQRSLSLRADSQNLHSNPQTQRPSHNQSQNLQDYYFILTPFINHNHFFESGNYNLSGFDYGFLTAFSGKVAESNYIGTHFIMSYGNLGDKKDKDFNIKSLNLNLGINYKLDLIFDMYLKARGDFYYFLNQAKTLTIFEAIKPNNLGFGLSVSYGKDFDFKEGGVLGLEVGLDYKAMQSSTISLQNNVDKATSETYKKSLYNLIYVDLGLNYAKYFNTNAGIWGVNAGLGIRGNITANKLATSKINISTFNKSVDMVLDNDIFLGYANLGASYMLNTKNFDMEFSLAYYGNYGDRGISNGAGVEWRVLF